MGLVTIAWHCHYRIVQVNILTLPNFGKQPFKPLEMLWKPPDSSMSKKKVRQPFMVQKQTLLLRMCSDVSGNSQLYKLILFSQGDLDVFMLGKTAKIIPQLCYIGPSLVRQSDF